MSTHINQDFEDAVRAMERGASDHQSAPNASANLPGADGPTGAPAGEGEGVSLSPAPGQCRESSQPGTTPGAASAVGAGFSSAPVQSAIASMSEEELLELARRFAAPGDGRYYFQRLHARGGVLAATDGRILLHVESPAVRDIGESSPKILGFRPEPAVRVAGADWVMGELAPRVSAEYARAEKRMLEKREEVEKEARRKMRTCPHCLGQFIVDDDGDLCDIDEYLAGELPDMAHDGPAVWLRFGNDRMARKVGLHYLATALDAARRLGGDAELWIGERIQVILRGAGWFVAIAMMRRDEPNDEDDIDIEVPKEDSEK